MSRRLAGALAGCLLLALPAAAQTPDSTATPAPPAPEASAIPAPVNTARADTARADTARSATRALRRSLLVPGWGQVANGQTAKVPVIALALVGATGVLVYQQRRYGLYFQSAFFAGCRETPDRDVCTNVSDAEDEWIATGRPSYASAMGTRDLAHGRRDLSVLAVGVVYALQALDAYVAAQLTGFDVSEDVAVRAVPRGLALRVGF